MSNFFTKKASETKGFGKKIGMEIGRKKAGSRAVVFGLKGDLGSGKTTFLQGFAQGLKIKRRISSPTFVIFRKYAIRDKSLNRMGHFYFFHFDCYRLKGLKEINYLGFEDIIRDKKNIVTVEWPERIGLAMPRWANIVSFSYCDEKSRRKVSFNKYGKDK